MFDKLATRDELISGIFSDKITELNKSIFIHYVKVIGENKITYLDILHKGKVYKVNHTIRSDNYKIIDSCDDEQLFQKMNDLEFLNNARETAKTYLTVLLNKCDTRNEIDFVLGDITDVLRLNEERVDHILKVQEEYEKEIRFIRKMKMASLLL